MSEITAVLVSYRRPDNMYLLTEALRTQTLVPELMLFNNWDMMTWQIERAMFAPWNPGPTLRHLLAIYAETEWVMHIDDDIIPADAEFVADALELAKQRPDSITAAWARSLHTSPPHYRGGAWGPCSIALGKFMIMRRELLTRVSLPPMWEPWAFRAEDIWLSLEIGNGKRAHWASKELAERLVALPEGGPDVALSLQEGHVEARCDACKWWLEHRQ